MDELKKIAELTLERMEKEQTASKHNKTYAEKQKEFKQKTAKLRSLIKGFKASAKDKQAEIDEEVMKVMKTFQHDRSIDAYKKKLAKDEQVKKNGKL